MYDKWLAMTTQEPNKSVGWNEACRLAMPIVNAYFALNVWSIFSIYNNKFHKFLIILLPTELLCQHSYLVPKSIFIYFVGIQMAKLF